MQIMLIANNFLLIRDSLIGMRFVDWHLNGKDKILTAYFAVYPKDACLCWKAVSSAIFLPENG